MFYLKGQYKIAICDDDNVFCMKIESYIYEYYGKNNVKLSIFYSGEEFIKSKDKYDCIFLDIEMIDLNGIEIATMIRNYDLDTYIIIVSGFPKYKNVAYRLHVFDYLDKPLKKTTLFRTLDDMTMLLKKKQNVQYEHFQTNQGLVKLRVNDIVYFEYSERKINLYTNNGHIYQFYDTIYKLEDKFKKYHFISPHKAFLVNVDYIQNIHSNDLILEKDIIIPISKLKRKQIKDALSNKYYQKSYKFVQNKFSGVSLKEVKWNIKDTLIFTIIVLSVPILIIMLNQAFSFSFNGTIISVLILILNVIIHEFGHSTALLLFGKKVANYKFKFKWIFPSIVCNTSEAYMLPNYEKIIVFYSGVLFNIISCMILWRLNYLQECMPTLGFIIFNLIPIPFLETDG